MVTATVFAAVTAQEIYFYSFLVGLVFAVISAILSDIFDFGDGADIDVDSGGADVGDGAVHLSPLSPTVVATFITAFGACGWILLEVGIDPWITLGASTVAGLGVGTAMFFLLYKVFLAFQGSSQPTGAEAIGVEANVIIPIPENGSGRIAYTLRRSRYTAGARHEDGRAVPQNTAVTIERIVGGTCYVREETREAIDRPTD